MEDQRLEYVARLLKNTEEEVMDVIKDYVERNNGLIITQNDDYKHDNLEVIVYDNDGNPMYMTVNAVKVEDDKLFVHIVLDDGTGWIDDRHPLKEDDDEWYCFDDQCGVCVGASMYDLLTVLPEYVSENNR
jgi:hypothetical protein